MPRRRLLPSALLISVLATAAAAQPAAPGSGRIEGAEALNVRSGPGLEHDVVGSLRRGDAVEVQRVDDKWARVRYRDGEGWVFARFVAVEPGATAAVATATATAAPAEAAIAGGAEAAPDAVSAPGAPPAPAAAQSEIVGEIRDDVARILTLTEAMHHDLERRRNSPPTATRGAAGISFQSGFGLLALGAVVGFLLGTILGRQQERRGRPRVRL